MRATEAIRRLRRKAGKSGRAKARTGGRASSLSSPSIPATFPLRANSERKSGLIRTRRDVGFVPGRPWAFSPRLDRWASGPSRGSPATVANSCFFLGSYAGKTRTAEPRPQQESSRSPIYSGRNCSVPYSSLPSPGQDRGDRVIPHRADDRADQAGKPPCVMVPERNGGYADIGNRPEAADTVKG
jgi:hypothetical protein